MQIYNITTNKYNSNFMAKKTTKCHHSQCMQELYDDINALKQEKISQADFIESFLKKTSELKFDKFASKNLSDKEKFYINSLYATIDLKGQGNIPKNFLMRCINNLTKKI